MLSLDTWIICCGVRCMPRSVQYLPVDYHACRVPSNSVPCCLVMPQGRSIRCCANRVPISSSRVISLWLFFFSLFFAHTFTFQLLDKLWSQVSSLLLPGSCLQFLSRIGFSNPTARRLYIECCLLTLSRFPQVNLPTRKSHNEFIRVCARRGSNSRN